MNTCLRWFLVSSTHSHTPSVWLSVRPIQYNVCVPIACICFARNFYKIEICLICFINYIHCTYEIFLIIILYVNLLLVAVDDDQVSTQILTALSAAVPVLDINGEHIESALVLDPLLWEILHENALMFNVTVLYKNVVWHMSIMFLIYALLYTDMKKKLTCFFEDSDGLGTCFPYPCEGTVWFEHCGQHLA